MVFRIEMLFYMTARRGNSFDDFLGLRPIEWVNFTAFLPSFRRNRLCNNALFCSSSRYAPKRDPVKALFLKRFLDPVFQRGDDHVKRWLAPFEAPLPHFHSCLKNHGNRFIGMI
jgi:hypothetical protein